MNEQMNTWTATLGQVLEQRPPQLRSHVPSMPLRSPHSPAKYRSFERSTNPKRGVGGGLRSLLLLLVLPRPQSPGIGLASPSCCVTPGKSPKLCLSCFIPKMASKMGVRLEDTPTGNTWSGAAKLLSISLIRRKDLEAWGHDVVLAARSC